MKIQPPVDQPKVYFFSSFFLTLLFAFCVSATSTSASAAETKAKTQSENKVPAQTSTDKSTVTTNEDDDFLNQDQQPVETLIAKLKANPSDLQSRSLLAARYTKSKEFKKVIETLDPFISELEPKTLLLLGAAYKAEKKFADEVRVYKILVAHQPQVNTAHYHLALAFEDNNQDADAIVSLRKAIELKSKDADSYEALLEIFIRQKSNYESRIVVGDMIKKFGARPKYLSQLCKIYGDDAYIDEAIQHCREAIQRDPANPENHGFLARAYKDKGDKEAAEKILKTATKRFVKSEFLQRQAGDLFFEQKNYGEAFRYYSLGVLADRNHYESQVGFARSAFQLGKYEESLMGYDNACKLNRETLKYFKESAATLRIDRNYEWEAKFNEALYRCQG